MKQTIANICYALGFGSIAASIASYSMWGVDLATTSDFGFRPSSSLDSCSRSNIDD